MLEVQEEDFWFDLPDEVRQSINIAKSELSDGKGIPHDQIMTEVRERS